MAVAADVKGVKVVLKLAKGTQTISNCQKTADDEALFTLGHAVGGLTQEGVETVSKVVESTLIEG
ncbi:hypothetical protein CS063_11970 [Sporanaerobium hydrogeniformans]|uniref:Uncharacterized protein n=1 Tax=Sporanaerobium hydrogeniformans TaxID=3072179 RepID=A0AC61DAX7_9FIRM|nr:hypothetical protein [Sporanaerobium hydrogeniformans]PHV70188.1 hypothetical protein CS063_11970 [Sporanaerobium hydrogeniformans]